MVRVSNTSNSLDREEGREQGREGNNKSRGCLYLHFATWHRQLEMKIRVKTKNMWCLEAWIPGCPEAAGELQAVPPSCLYCACPHRPLYTSKVHHPSICLVKMFFGAWSRGDDAFITFNISSIPIIFPITLTALSVIHDILSLLGSSKALHIYLNTPSSPWLLS